MLFNQATVLMNKYIMAKLDCLGEWSADNLPDSTHYVQAFTGNYTVDGSSVSTTINTLNLNIQALFHIN